MQVLLDESWIRRSEYDPAFPAAFSPADIDAAKKTWAAQGREIKEYLTRNRIRRKHEQIRACVATLREERNKFDDRVSDYFRSLQ